MRPSRRLLDIEMAMSDLPCSTRTMLPTLPPGFVHPEFPGSDAGYNTWAIDPRHYQILSLAGTGPDGGRALAFMPLDVDRIRMNTSARMR